MFTYFFWNCSCNLANPLSSRNFYTEVGSNSDVDEDIHLQGYLDTETFSQKNDEPHSQNYLVVGSYDDNDHDA